MAFLDYTVEEFFALIIAILVGFTVHEAAHGLTALKLGDDTAKRQGRVNLNPINHIDPMGLIMIFVAGFGWARPVPINPGKLKQPYRDEVLIALAGPASNLVVAFIGIIILKAVIGGAATGGLTAGIADKLAPGLLLFVYVNLGMGIFNLMPIPPLDGSHLITARFRVSNPALAARLTYLGGYLFFAIILIEAVTPFRILPVPQIVGGVFRWMVGIIS